MKDFANLRIAVAGTGYVGLSIATLLAQHHKVIAVDVVPEKVELINNKKSPIQDEYEVPFGKGTQSDSYAGWQVCLQRGRLCGNSGTYQL